MNKYALRSALARLTIGASVWFAGMALVPITAAQASAGLVVVIANEYDGHLTGVQRDADAIASKLEAEGFDAVRMLGLPGAAVAGGIEQVRSAAKSAGPLRIIYASGFGMCLNDDLFLFAEDMQPEQFASGKVGDFIVPLSIVAEAAAAGGSQTLVVFDISPFECTRDTLQAFRLSPNWALLVTTGIGGDVIDELNEDGIGAFTIAFLQQFVSDRPPNDIIDKVIEQIRIMTGDRQVPILFGKL